jgi:hypothetical protein
MKVVPRDLHSIPHEVVYEGSDFYVVACIGEYVTFDHTNIVRKSNWVEYVRPVEVGDMVHVRRDGSTEWSYTEHTVLCIYGRANWVVTAYKGDIPTVRTSSNLRLVGGSA